MTKSSIHLKAFSFLALLWLAHPAPAIDCRAVLHLSPTEAVPGGASNPKTNLYRGYVHSVREGIAYLTLEVGTRTVEIEWSARELEALGIKDGSPFVLIITETPSETNFTFLKAAPGRLSEETLQAIRNFSQYYGEAPQ